MLSRRKPVSLRADLALTRNHHPSGLNTNPNLSFMATLPLPPGFVRFQNNHQHRASGLAQQQPRLQPHPTSAPPPQALATLVQTDGLGLGAWNKEGRGSMPYSWEVTLPDLEIQPALLAMFYQQASVNDSFVACLSGPGSKARHGSSKNYDV